MSCSRRSLCKTPLADLHRSAEKTFLAHPLGNTLRQHPVNDGGILVIGEVAGRCRRIANAFNDSLVAGARYRGDVLPIRKAA